MAFKKLVDRLSPLSNKRDIRKTDIVNDSRINIVKQIPVNLQGRNGDMQLYVSPKQTTLYCKVNDSWRAVNSIENLHSSTHYNIISEDDSLINQESHDSGWIDVIDEVDSNNIDPEDGSQRKVSIDHGLNARILDINVFARFEALENGQLKTHIINLNSHISSPGPNASKFGYWINIRDNNIYR